MFSTPLRPEIVEDKATKDVKGLMEISEAVGVVREEIGGVVFVLQGDFSNKRERPGDLDNSVGFSIRPRCVRKLSRRFELLGNREGSVAGSLRRPNCIPCITGGRPMILSHEPTGRPWLRVNEMRVLAFLGWALCHILA